MKVPRWGAVAAAVFLLAACTPGEESTPSPSPTVSSTSAHPTPPPTSDPPTPTPTTEPPSPTPTETLDADQIAARDVVLEFYRFQNEFGMDDSVMDITPLTNITTGNAQTLTVNALSKYRELNAIQTAPVEVYLQSIGLVTPDADGIDLVRVEVCTDASQVDMVDKETRESVLTAERTPVVLSQLDVVREADAWLVSDIKGTPTEACS